MERGERGRVRGRGIGDRALKRGKVEWGRVRGRGRADRALERGGGERG